MIDYVEDTRHLQKLKANGFNPKLVVDVGASNGEFYNECRKIFTDAEYMLFEARKYEETSIAETIADIEPKPELIYDTLLGTNIGKIVKFFNMNAGSSIYEENTKFPRTVEKKRMRALEEFLIGRMKKPAFLKIDTQGSELDILESLFGLQYYFEVIQLEVALLEYNKKAPTVADIHNFMDSIGFALYDFGPAFCRQSDNAIFHMDWIFVQKNSKLRSKKLFWNVEKDF